MAQIDGKYNTTPKDKVILDLFYIENFSLMLDMKMIFRTVTVFFRRDSTEGFHINRRVKCPPIRMPAAYEACGNPAESGRAKQTGFEPDMGGAELVRENIANETVFFAGEAVESPAGGKRLV
ncbi:MAG: sugar transferase, partial [Eubacteriales bacterium]|nr:sugar transferase [Eubacteriales bacterium]